MNPLGLCETKLNQQQQKNEFGRHENLAPPEQKPAAMFHLFGIRQRLRTSQIVAVALPLFRKEIL